jgi:hypothetical protein
MRKVGNRLIIEPAPPKSLLAVLATLKPLDEDFPPISDAPPDRLALNGVPTSIHREGRRLHKPRGALRRRYWQYSAAASIRRSR